MRCPHQSPFHNLTHLISFTYETQNLSLEAMKQRFRMGNVQARSCLLVLDVCTKLDLDFAISQDDPLKVNHEPCVSMDLVKV